jgi:TP901 family phage tail tape measure protein
MASNAELIVKIGANSEKYRKELNKLEKQTEASVARMQKRARIAAVGFAAAAAGGIAAFNQFAQFESTFSNVVTLLDQGSFRTKTLNEGVDDLKKGLLELRASTGETFDNLNKGLFDLISAGVAADDAIGVLKTATDLAKAGATSTSVAVDGLTSALNAYNLEGENAQAVSEAFFTAQKFGKTTIEELSGSIGQAAPIAASLGVSLNELLAAVSASTTAGIKTSEAFTGLKAVFSNVIKPTKDAADEAAMLGIQFDAAALRSKGLAGFIDEITQSANFNKDSLGRLFGSVEALNVVTALAGNQSDEFADTLTALGNEAQSAATFQDALAAKTETAEDKIRRMNGAIEAATVALGELVAPAVIAFVEESTTQIINLTEGFEALGVIVSGVATIIKETFGSAIAFLLSGVKQVQSAFDGLVASTNEGLARLPFLSEDRRSQLLGNAAQARGNQDVNAAIGEDLARQGLDFFTTTDEEAEAALERQRDFQQQKNSILAEGLEEERALRIESLEADQEAGLSRPLEQQTEEQFEETVERQRERSAELLKNEKDAQKKQQTERTKHEKTLEKLKQDRAKAEEQLDAVIVDSSFKALNQIVGDNKAAQTALFLAEKGVTIAKIIMNAQQAASLAIATIPPPAGEAIAAQRIAMGKVQAGIVAATALPELIGTIAAQQGGIVPGFGGGDRIPAVLEPGEMVVPKALTPTFAGIMQDLQFEGGGNSKTETDVMIGIEDDAARFITIKQREDRILGVQR